MNTILDISYLYANELQTFYLNVYVKSVKFFVRERQQRYLDTRDVTINKNTYNIKGISK